MKRLCVFAGSNAGMNPSYRTAARDTGLTLAQRGIELVYGGGCVGLMGDMADAALAAGGRVIGVIPRALMAREVGHRGLSDLRVVSSMHERKALMAELSDGFIAMPGGWGTLDELFEILTWGQLGLHGKPVGLLNTAGYFDRLLDFLEHAVQEGFVRGEHTAAVAVAEGPSALIDRMAAWVPPLVEKWIDPASA